MPAAGIAAGTIKNTYKDMHPYLRALVPKSFATDEQLALLPDPDRSMPKGSAAAAAVKAEAPGTSALTAASPGAKQEPKLES